MWIFWVFQLLRFAFLPISSVCLILFFHLSLEIVTWLTEEQMIPEAKFTTDNWLVSCKLYSTWTTPFVGASISTKPIHDQLFYFLFTPAFSKILKKKRERNDCVCPLLKLLNIFYFQSISGTCLHLLCASDFHLDKAHKSVNNALWLIRSFGGCGTIFTWLIIFRFCNKDIFPETADFTQMLTCRQIINPFFILRVSFSVQLAIFPLCGDTLGLNIWKKMEQ